MKRTGETHLGKHTHTHTHSDSQCLSLSLSLEGCEYDAGPEGQTFILSSPLIVDFLSHDVLLIT